MEQKIKEYVKELASQNKEISLFDIQAQLNCSLKEVTAVLANLDLDSLVDTAADFQSGNKEHAYAALDNIGDSAATSKEEMPMLVDATIYQMQKTFSEMAHELWKSLAEKSQSEIKAVKHRLDSQLSVVNNEYLLVSSELETVKQSLLASEKNTLERNDYIKDLEQNLEELNNQLGLSLQDNNSLLELIENLKSKVEKKEKNIEEVEKVLVSTSNETVNIEKKLNRVEKEKVFLTKEFKSVQKELIQAQSIIDELYENNLVDSYTLEKAGYKKHQTALNSQSLTSKLFKK